MRSEKRVESLEVVVDGKVKARYDVVIRKPVVNVGLKVLSKPDRLGIGLTGKAILELIDDGSEADPGILVVRVNDTLYKTELSKGEKKSLEVSVVHGENKIIVLRGDKVLDTTHIYIEPVRPEVTIKPLSEYAFDQLVLKPDVNCSFEFIIESANNVPYRVDEVIASINDTKCRVNILSSELVRTIYRFVVYVDKLDVYKPINRLYIMVKYSDMDGRIYSLSRDYNVKLWIEGYGYIDEYLSKLKERAEKLREYTAIDSVIEEATSIVEECSKLRKITRDKDICSGLDNLYDVLFKFYLEAVNGHDFDGASAILDIVEDFCREVFIPSYCRKTESFRKHIRFIENSIKLFRESLSANKPLSERVDVCKRALDLCNKTGLDIDWCKKIKSVYEDLMKEYNGLIKQARELYNTMSRGLRIGSYRVVFENLSKFIDICNNLGSIDVCKNTSGVLESTRRINEFLESVRVVVPESSLSKTFRVKIEVVNSLDKPVGNLYVDFTSSKQYFLVEENRVLFTLIPSGKRVSRTIYFSAREEGKLPLRYSVCLGDYCIEKSTYIDIGVRKAIREKPVTPTIATPVLIGYSIYSLHRYRLDFVKGSRLREHMRFAEYTCYSLLGEGGFSVTLLCVDSSGYNVVVKIPREFFLELMVSEPGRLKTYTGRDLEAFEREASILKELDHPNIVRLIDYRVKPTPMLILEYCELGDLSRLLSISGRLDPRVVLEIMIPIVSALAVAHNHKPPIIHRDIKPSNILLTRDYVPKLTDFNIAKIMSTVSESSRTKAYTEAYAAPEQLRTGDSKLPPPGPYTDIWSIGVVMYEMLTARKPYNPEELKQKDLDKIEKPEPPSKYNKQVPKELDNIIIEMLQPNPINRIQDTNKLLTRLVQIYHETIEKRL